MKFLAWLWAGLLRFDQRLGWFLAKNVPMLRPIHETRNTQTPITFRMWYWQFVRGYNGHVYWPVHFTSIIGGPASNVYCGIETSPGYMPGCYIQAMGKIFVGDYTQISANVGIITANHDLHDNSRHITADVHIGAYSWIGMNAMILPGVTLGEFTVVGAGAVVTKSFEEGYCVLGGNPARVIRKLEPEKCVRHKSAHEYNGYIPHADFEEYRKKNLAL